MEILASLSAQAQNEAWTDMEEQLKRFTTADGWCGPNELLLGSGRLQAHLPDLSAGGATSPG